MKRRSQEGMGKLSLLFWVCAIGFLVYSLFQILPFYYDAEEIEGLMQSQARKASVLPDDKIRNNIMSRVKQLGAPMDPDRLRINRFQGKIIIEGEYSEIFYIDLSVIPLEWFKGKVIDIYTFQFHPRAEANL